MIHKVTKSIVKEICKEPARVQYEPTGRFELRNEIDEKGKTIKVEVPIKRKITIDPVYETIVEELTVYSVEVDGETHEFATMKEAREFKKILKGKA